MLGEDFGRDADLTILLPLQENPGLKWKAPFQVELRNVPFKQQEQILFYIVDRLPRFRAGALDARGNGQYLAEVAAQKYGAGRISQVKASVELYREHAPKFKAALEDKNILLPLDPDIIDDYRMVKLIKGVAGIPDGAKNKGRDGYSRHADSYIAGLMAWYARNQEVIDTEILHGRQRETAEMVEGYQ